MILEYTGTSWAALKRTTSLIVTSTQQNLVYFSPRITRCQLQSSVHIPILSHTSQSMCAKMMSISQQLGRVGVLGDYQWQTQFPYSLLCHRQRQQYRTRVKVIDFDQFTPEGIAEKEQKIQREYIKRLRKKASREQRQRNREKLEAEEKTKYIFRYDIWEETIKNLLSLETYPIGFSNTAERTVIASWCQQVSHTLQQSLSVNASVSLESMLQLLDRLFDEQDAHTPGIPTAVQVLLSPDISSSAIESALKSWKFSLLYPPYYEKLTEDDVERAQERVLKYSNFLAKHEDSMLEQISKLLDVDRIVHSKTTTTDRLLWGHIPNTVHPNANDTNAKIYMKSMNNDTEEEE